MPKPETAYALACGSVQRWQYGPIVLTLWKEHSTYHVMRTQQDCRYRIVALDNLRAMCEHASGMAHTFEVTKVSRSRVHVTYSNPDEYGRPEPITAVFPCYPSVWPDDGSDNPRVVLDCIRTIGDDQNGSGYQVIDSDIVRGPSMWRRGADAKFSTHKELQAEGIGSPVQGKCTSCVVCDAEETGRD